MDKSQKHVQQKKSDTKDYLLIDPIYIKFKNILGNSLVVQCLGHQAFIVEGIGSIFGKGTKIPKAPLQGHKGKKKRKKKEQKRKHSKRLFKVRKVVTL